MILAAHLELCAPATVAAATEELGEEIAEVGRITFERPATRELEPGIPVGRRTEVLPRAVAASELVVGGALFGVRKHRMRLVHFLHPRLGVLFLRDVRVVLARELAVGLLDLVLRRFARHAERLVVVLEFHRALLRPPAKKTRRAAGSCFVRDPLRVAF